MRRKEAFKFINPGLLRDGDLTVALVKKSPANPAKGYVPSYEFELRRRGRRQALGAVRLRIASAAKLRYPGHIGYEVKERFRGRRYAARACRLLLPLALAHGLKAVWLSVRPGNIPSCRTCEILGAQYRGTVRIPAAHEMCLSGKPYVRRYRLITAPGL